MADSKNSPRSALEVVTVSLLWPADKPRDSRTPPSWAQDLGLDDLARAFSAQSRYMPFIRQTLAALNADPMVIGWRQAVFNDLLRNAPLVERLAALLPRFGDLYVGHALLGKHKRNVLLETADRLAELDLYLEVVEELNAALLDADLRSPALTALRQNIQAAIVDPTFQALRTELPELRRPLQTFASLTIGINLNSQMQPVSAVLLNVNDRPFAEARSFLGKLLGPAQDADDSGIAPLHFTPSDPDQRPLSPLFRDLERLISQTMQPVIRALTRYSRLSTRPLAALENELAFYLSAIALMRRLEARGIAVCMPEVAPAEERITTISGLVNIHLALREPDRAMVSNDAAFDDQGRIAVLTGLNSGGKTTYMNAIGLAHVLFQAGLFIPARQARISPTDAIFTHFPALETQQGRLSEEANRLRTICLNATRHSLVLLDESLSSTAAGEALYLAQDLLAGLRAIGVRAIYATHLLELPEHLDDIEKAVAGDAKTYSKIYSLIAGVQLTEDAATGELHAVPTYQITRGSPQGRSYAREIARRYGISLEQILQARGINTKP